MANTSGAFSFPSGQRFGLLTVLERTDQRNRDGVILWRCRCDCGNEILRRADNLAHGHNQSCGCLNRQALRDRNFRHGDAGGGGTKLYRVWEMLKERTGKPNSWNFKNFGARGVTLCEEWVDFITFRDWAMANGYANDLSIQLIDRRGRYAPENCAWARSTNYRLLKKRAAKAECTNARIGTSMKEMETDIAATREAAMTG